MANTDELVLTATEFDINKISYSIQPKSFEIKDADGNKTKLSYTSIVLKYDGNSEWYVVAPKMFSFGIKRSSFGGSKPKFSTSFIMKDKEGATPEQQLFFTKVDQLTKKTINWMIEHKTELKTPGLAENMLENLSPIYLKKDDNGNVVDGAIPSLNCGLKQKDLTILSKFYNERDEEVDPMTLITTEKEKKYYTMVEGYVSFPDVYYAKGKPAKLHCMLDEVTIQTKQERVGRLRDKKKMLFTPQELPTSSSNDDSDNDVSTSPAVQPKVVKNEEEEDDIDESEEEEVVAPKKQTKTTTKGVPRRAK